MGTSALPYLAVALVLVAAAGCGDDSTSLEADERVPTAAETDTVDGEQARWEPLPDAPLTARHGAVAVWTGSSVVVVGGRDTDPCPPDAGCTAPPRPPLRDGARFDPATGVWSTIADAPVPITSGSEPAVVGGRVFMLVERSVSEPDASAASFIAYDPAADTWETLPAPPEEAGDWLRLVAAGDRVVAYQGSQELGPAPDVVFDPTTETWSVLPPDPLAPSFDRSMLWTGDHLVLLGKEVVPNPGSERPAVVRAARLAGLDGDWERLADSEILGWDFRFVGERVVSADLGGADGGETNPYGRTYPHGGMLDPATGEWEPLPGDVPTPEQAYEAGGEVYESSAPAAGGDLIAVHGYVLHVPSGRWIPLSRPDGGPDGGAARVVAGDRIITWGGYTWGDSTGTSTATLLDQGWVWSSPSES